MSPTWNARSRPGWALIRSTQPGKAAIWAAPYGTSPMTAKLVAEGLS